MEIWELPEKEFKIIILRELSKIKENTEWQLNELRKTISEQKWEVNIKIEIIKKENQIKILKLKNIMNDTRKAIKIFNIRVYQVEERIC